jgi:hypothetical protein
MRTKKDALIDRLLMLFAIEAGNKYGHMDGSFKLMKIPFMAQLESTEQGVNTFNYTFYRYDHGPITTEIYEDASQLHKVGLLSAPIKGKCPITTTQAGKNLIAELAEVFEENRRVCDFVEASAKAYAWMRFGDLKKKVYAREVEVEGSKIKVADVPCLQTVLSKLSGDVEHFRLDDDWLDTIWGDLNYTEDEKLQMRRIRPMSVCAAS